MKPTSINVQITKCPKQYEAVRLGIDASLDEGETAESAIKAATAQLNALYVEMYQPKPKVAQNGEKTAKNGNEQVAEEKPKEEKPKGKEKLEFGDARVQAIVKRIEKAAGDKAKIAEIMENVKKYYEPDENVQKVLTTAVKLNQ